MEVGMVCNYKLTAMKDKDDYLHALKNHTSLGFNNPMNSESFPTQLPGSGRMANGHSML